MENDPYLSVIIPANTEGELHGRTLLEIEHHLGPKDFRYEILVIEIHLPRYRELMGDMGNLLIRATLG